MRRALAVNVLICLVMAATTLATEDEDKEFTNMWVAEIHGGEEVARRVARDLGYNYDGQAVFDNHYIFKREDHPEVSKRNSLHLTKSLTDLDEVAWAEQQSLVKRSKRGIVPEEPRQLEPRQSFFSFMNAMNSGKLGGYKPKPSSSFGSSFGSFYGSGPGKLSFKPLSQSDNSGSSSSAGTSKLGSFSTKPTSTSLNTYQGVTQHIECLSSKRSAYEKMFNDPLWTKQWYAQDYRTEDMPVMDLNVVPVYKMEITGKGVTVAVVDDGLQSHPDLEGNYQYDLSYDMCNDEPGSEPDPSTGHPNSHGTKCAGEIAMVANNNKCGVGIAYNSKVAGIKILGRRAVDYSEARGLNHKLKSFDIYSNSWGPPDDGATMEKIGRLSALAIEKGVTEGRDGKGVVYVFAAGNGRHNGDNCAADGLINFAHTIPITSVSQKGKTVYYSERCSAVFAGAYSSGNGYDEKIASIDLDGECTTSFSGTSAAAPIATGIIALTLEANSGLTSRDIMHLIAMSSEVAPVADNGDIWYKNGKGFWVSNDFGFGLMNAENMVRMAKEWTNVPEKNTCIVSVSLDDPQYVAVGEIAEIQFETEGCQDSEEDAVFFLEQIEVASTVDYPYRGALSITITSPAGTKTTLLEPRPNDASRNGLKEWSIKSVHNWGEDPKGTWEIEVKANPLSGVRSASGYVSEFTITFHGTAKKPDYHDKLPRKYSGFRLSNGKTSEV